MSSSRNGTSSLQMKTSTTGPVMATLMFELVNSASDAVRLLLFCEASLYRIRETGITSLLADDAINHTRLSPSVRDQPFKI